nr:IS3 family transposase [Frisingicoccus sp.]
MRFLFPEERLLGHPCVYKVDRWKLTLTCGFRIKLYEAWKPEQSAAEIAVLLRENGLTPDLVGTDYHITLANGFKGSGYPIFNRTEASSVKDYEETNPIVLSGKFVRTEHGNGIIISPKLREELLSKYPDISVEEGLRQAGIDPVDVGYQRINRIQKDLEREQKHIYHKQVDEFLDYSTDDFSDESGNISESNLEENPYIQDIRYDRIVLKDCFYNECYVLYPLGIGKILNIYEMEANAFTEKNKIAIGSRLFHWNKTGAEVEIVNEQTLRIQRARTQAINSLVKGGFDEISIAIKKMDIDSRRKLCRWISELPRDITGYYTTAAVRKMLGISKSTYYALLNDDNYGISIKRKSNQDNVDIEVIRQVLNYKGFEKGIRQVYMLMPKVTGEQFSIYRIRRLMNKYGIRTTIRRPSKNRKAMKELIARNKKANLLMRKFKLHRPNEVRLTDVTYLDYGDGLRAYGSASVDPVTGRLICFIISENNDLQLALDTLEAMDSYPAKSGAILHSDQGILYMTDDFQAAVVERELTQSMSRRGNCWDNAVQESFFGHFKDECHYENCKTFEELQKCIAEYSDYYNNERGMWDKGKMTPTEYEKYLTEMDDEAFLKYLASEEKKYLDMKEKAANKAVQNAKEYKAFIEEAMEELK